MNERRHPIWIDDDEETLEKVEALLQDAGIMYYQTERD